MTAQKYLLENNLDNKVLNAKEFPENTPENAKKWIYLSDVLNQYSKQQIENLTEGQELFNAINRITGHDALETEMDEIIEAIKKDNKI